VPHAFSVRHHESAVFIKLHTKNSAAYLGIRCTRPPNKSGFVAIEAGVDTKVKTVQLSVEQHVRLDTAHKQC